MGTILTAGALAMVGSMNFQRSRTPGSWAGCFFAASRRPEGAVRRAVPQHLEDQRLVREAEDVVEVARGVLGVAAGVRAAQHGHRAPLADTGC